MDENLKKIKEIILQTAKEMNIEIDKIILFGSRARGDYREDSDYDILIVTKKKLEWKKRKMFWLNIRRKIEHKIDLLITDKQTFEEKKDELWNVIHEAFVEGRVI
ncbi:MAG: nucleotidyltransferase domain-containing protein [Candidatus Aenigmatarchaeota archaeon]